MLVRDSIDGGEVSRIVAPCSYACHAAYIGQKISPCPICSRGLHLQPADRCPHGNYAPGCWLCKPVSFVLTRKAKGKWAVEPEDPEPEAGDPEPEEAREEAEEREEEVLEEEIFKEAEEEEELNE